MSRHLFKLAIFVILWQKLLNGLGEMLKRLLKFCCPKILKRWDSSSSFYRKFLLNVFVGLSVFWFMMIFDKNHLLMDTKDAGMDLAMQLRQNIIPAMEDKKIPGFVFIDVDNASHHQWNEPLITPRDKIKNLIAAAVQGQAKLVVVDYDLSRSIPVEAGAPLHSDDQALKDYLASYASEHCQANKSCPPIILLRTFQSSSKSIPILRVSFLDEAVQQSAPYVQWGTAVFYRSIYDQYVRRWRLWDTVCIENQPAVIPSIELLAAALIRNKYPLTEGTSSLTPTQTQMLLKKRLAEFQPENCQHKKELAELPTQIEIGELIVNTDKRGIHQRVIFSLSWLVEGKPPELPHLQFDKSNTPPPILTILSARNYAKLPVDTNKINVFQDKVVILGTSSSRGRDIYLTPLGKMPGAMIIINAIHSLLEYEMIESVPLWAQHIGMVLLILMMSWLFTRSGSFVAMLLSGGVIIFLLLPITIALFRYGVWLDFALPLLVVQFYRMATNFDELHKQCQIQEKKAFLN